MHRGLHHHATQSDLEVELLALDGDGGSALALVGRTGDGGGDQPLAVGLHDDAVLGKLLLNQHHALCPFDHKVASCTVEA